VLAMKPLDPDSDWKCDHCSYRLTSADVDKITNKLQKEYDAIGDNDVELFESFLKSHISLLHPNHYLFTNARHSLNELYGYDPRYPIETLSPALLERKIDLCQKVLSIADVIEPGLTLTRGNILYDMHLPIVFLAKNQFENQDISEENFKKRMLQTQVIVEESYRILSLEPADSDKGVIAKTLQRELRRMQHFFKFY